MNEEDGLDESAYSFSLTSPSLMLVRIVLITSDEKSVIDNVNLRSSPS